MKRHVHAGICAVIVIALLSNAVSAQFVVYDPTNYFQALTRYAQLVEQYRFWVAQARRLPQNLAARYRLQPVRWSTYANVATTPYAEALL